MEKIDKCDNDSLGGKNGRTITYLDLFAGAGGLSEGFASAGFKPLAHVEMNIDACDTLRTRECYYYLKRRKEEIKYKDYLLHKISRDELYASVPRQILDAVICKTMSVDTMPEVFQSIDKAMKYKRANRVDLILGGPPCQAYSTIGRARKDMAKDPRNTLYKLYLLAIERYQPEMFVFENVPGLLSAGDGRYIKSIIEGFHRLGYELEYHVLNASDYGVLQYRKRIILIGWRKGTNHSYPKLQEEPRLYTIEEILYDLCPIAPGEESVEYTNSPRGYILEKGIRSSEDVLTWHIARPHNERDREIYRLAIEAWNNGGQRLKYTDLPDGLITHNNRSSFLDRFKVVAKELPASQTMVAHISKDGHYYIHPDFFQARSISVREAARIQSFPDNYFFEGSRTAAFLQIGNAVPPMLAQRIAKALKNQF